MSSAPRARRAFTLIEALVAITLLGVGITATMGGLSEIAKAEGRLRDRERMQKLAIDKLNEIIGTGETQSASLNGDFADRSETRFTWSAEVQPTGIENLDSVVVTVQKRDNAETSLDVSSLLYTAPIETETGATNP